MQVKSISRPITQESYRSSFYKPELLKVSPQFAVPSEQFSWLPANAGGPGIYFVSSGALPVGLTLNGATGEISGTVSDSIGVYSLEITCINAFGSSSIPVLIQIPNERWVDGSAGSDSNAGTSSGAAWATIDHAIDTIAASGNFLIHIADGSYVENDGSGYMLWNGYNFTNCVCFKAASSGGVTVTSSSGSYVVRVNSLGISNIKFDGLKFTTRAGSTDQVFFFTSAGSSSKLYFNNFEFEAAHAVSAGVGLIDSNHTMSELIFENTVFDCELATSSAFARLTGTATDVTFNNVTASGNGYNSNAAFRFDEAAGAWNFYNCDLATTANAIAVWFQSTAQKPAIKVWDSTVQSSGDDAFVIAGGTSGNNISEVYSKNLTASGDGGFLVEAYVDKVTVDGGSFTGVANSALAISNDGSTGIVNNILVTHGPVIRSSGHGLLLGLFAENAVVDSGSYDGGDHSIVVKANGFSISGVTAESGSGSALLCKGARDGVITRNHLNNSQAGAFCLDCREQDATVSDNLRIQQNTLNATGSAKAMNFVSAGIGNAITENGNFVIGNETAEILGNSVSDVDDWNSLGWDTPSPYAISGNGIEA